jgi:hypothetical protein
MFPPPMSHVVPAGEKKGSVRNLMPSISKIAVAVPMCVTLKELLKIEDDIVDINAAILVLSKY